VDVSWDGPEPKNRISCPYPIEFASNPAPAEALNSLESGRFLLQVDLGSGVRMVSARLVNNAKRENLERVKGTNGPMQKTFLTTLLVQDNQRPGRWTGELDGRRQEHIREDRRCKPEK
jgi:hypothetical protein